jgi:hypothetical protein
MRLNEQTYERMGWTLPGRAPNRSVGDSGDHQRWVLLRKGPKRDIGFRLIR